MATIRDVARRAGVSVATVSAVMNNSRNVSAPLRRRVEAAIAELDYRPNVLARALYKKRSHSIAFLVPDVSNPGFSKALRSVERTANKYGYSVFLGNTDGSPHVTDSYIERLIDMRFDGVLIALTWELARDELVQRLQHHGIHCVGIAGARVLPNIDCYIGDEEQAGYDLGRHLVELGHRHCGFVGPENSQVAQLRLSGLRRAFAEAGGEIPETAVAESAGYAGEAYVETAQHLITAEHCTAVVAFNDRIATYVLDAAASSGLSVPHDISVATFGNSYAHITRPKLTTMIHDEARAAHLATERLIERIEGKEPPVTCERLPMRLAVRDSTAPPATTQI